MPRGVTVLGDWISMYFRAVKEKARIGTLTKAQVILCPLEWKSKLWICF